MKVLVYLPHAHICRFQYTLFQIIPNVSFQLEGDMLCGHVYIMHS